MSNAALAVLLLVAVLGHVMALGWYLLGRQKRQLTQRMIYDLRCKQSQIRRELQNSWHAPMHALILLGFLLLGCFTSVGLGSFVGTLLLTSVWAEIWHYCSHRAFHLPRLHWIHAEHHKSHLNTPFTAISFSFVEKLIFDIGLLGVLAGVDRFVGLSFVGIGAWYIGYLVVNSFSHANFELRPKNYNSFLGKGLTTATYHSLHHSRYTGNYGLGTRLLDRLFETEWPDYERIYDRISLEQRPLTRLLERG